MTIIVQGGVGLGRITIIEIPVIGHITVRDVGIVDEKYLVGVQALGGVIDRKLCVRDIKNGHVPSDGIRCPLMVDEQTDRVISGV